MLMMMDSRESNIRAKLALADERHAIEEQTDKDALKPISILSESPGSSSHGSEGMMSMTSSLVGTGAVPPTTYGKENALRNTPGRGSQQLNVPIMDSPSKRATALSPKKKA